MIDLILTAGIPVICSLMGALWFSTRAWQLGYSRARHRNTHGHLQ